MQSPERYHVKDGSFLQRRAMREKSGACLQVAAVLALGAAGAVMGTRFAATKESMYSEAKKQRYLAATAADTHRTRLYDDLGSVAWPAGVDSRTIGNTFSRTHGTVAPKEVSSPSQMLGPPALAVTDRQVCK